MSQKANKAKREPMSSDMRILLIVGSMIVAMLIIAIIGLVNSGNEGTEAPESSPTPTDTIQAEETTEPTEPAPSQPSAPAPVPSIPAPSQPSPSPSDASDSIDTGTGYSVAEILTFLDALEVASSVDNSGYDRDLFGSGWLDTDNNGCDARNDILLRDLIDVTIDSDGCRVLSGTLNDSYTGETVAFVRGQQTSSDVQIDHLIPLSRAWAMGADEWNEQTRRAFANDPANLFAVGGSVNNNKSDQGIESWTTAIYDCILDKRAAGASAGAANTACNNAADLYSGSYYTAFECEYAARYVIVSYRYDLAVTSGDASRVKKALDLCGATNG